MNQGGGGRAPLRWTVCLRRRREKVSGWKQRAWRRFSPALAAACGRVALPAELGRPCGPNLCRGGRSIFYFHSHFYFLLTEKLGIRAVFFATSNSPKPQNEIFFFKREGRLVLSSPPPLGQADDGGVWRQGPRPGPSGHSRAQALAKRLAPWASGDVATGVCVWGSQTLPCFFTRQNIAERSGFLRVLRRNAFGDSTRGLHQGSDPIWGQMSMCL